MDRDSDANGWKSGKLKQSSTDLQSRLKSRKILGVGVTDDGQDVHRSKVSQILGHSDALSARTLPLGIQWWLFLCSILLICWAFWSVLLPGSFMNKMFGGTQQTSLLYSITLFCLAMPLAALSQVNDRSSIQWSLLSLEILLTTHALGSFYGGVLNTFLFLGMLVLANTWYIFKMAADQSLLLELLRNFTQPDDNVDESHSRSNRCHVSSTDKKSD